MGSYTLMFAALILTAGALGDRFGARRMFSTGFIVFVSASVACGLAHDMAILIGARAVQGVGAAMLGACSLAGCLITPSTILTSEPGHSDAAGAAVALLPARVAGVPIAEVGWRSIFFINVPLGAFGWYLARRYIRETDRASRRVDVAGQMLVVVGLGALTGALIRAGSAGFGDPLVIAALALAALARRGSSFESSCWSPCCP